MIKLQNYTPQVYYNESRDFQFIGRLFDLAINYAKTNAELVHNLPLSDNSDDQFIELLAYTLGFKPRHKYTAKHLRAVCSALSEIFRNKGTLKAFKLACAAIFNSEGINKEVDYEERRLNNVVELILYLPPELTDTTLLTDLFDYILPAGVCCRLIKTIQEDAAGAIALGTRDSIDLFNSQSLVHNTNNEYAEVSDNKTYSGGTVGEDKRAFVNDFIYKEEEE